MDWWKAYVWPERKVLQRISKYFEILNMSTSTVQKNASRKKRKYFEVWTNVYNNKKSQKMRGTLFKEKVVQGTNKKWIWKICMLSACCMAVSLVCRTQALFLKQCSLLMFCALSTHPSNSCRKRQEGIGLETTSGTSIPHEACETMHVVFLAWPPRLPVQSSSRTNCPCSSIFLLCCGTAGKREALHYMNAILRECFDQPDRITRVIVAMR